MFFNSGINRFFELIAHGVRYLDHKVLGNYSSFGSNIAIDRQVIVKNSSAISIGNSVHLQEGVWLNALKPTGPLIQIGTGCDLGRYTFISANKSVVIGNNVLFAPNVFISDHSHEYHDKRKPILLQGITSPQPIHIGDGSWIGINCVILPGTYIGKHCVIGANSVVKGRFSSHSLIVGAPAKCVKKLS